MSIRSKARVGLGLTAAIITGSMATAIMAAQPLQTPTTALADGTDQSVEQQYAPEVRRLSDGTLVQRTPDEIISGSNSTFAFQRPKQNVPHNTYYLHADNKGCESCHEDLGETLASMPMFHFTIENNLGLDVGIQDCFDCHDLSAAQTTKGSLGAKIHAIHEDVANCWNCHYTDDGDGTMYLWDEVKHQKLNGITDIADEAMGDDFSWRQDEVIDQDALFDVLWQNRESDLARGDYIFNNDPVDQEIFDNWAISIVGEVENELTWTLPELIEQAPSETRLIKLHCTDNLNGGPWIGQVECTGIPIQWILEQAGVKEGAQQLLTRDPSGSQGKISLSRIEDHAALLVYEINGEPLNWHQGYPCVTLFGGVTAAADRKGTTEFEVSANVIPEYFGFRNADDVYINKPNVGIFDLPEGKIFLTGETVDLHGYADAFEETITGIEISMDRGKTWKHFDIDNANNDQWVTWNYEFTPEEPGAYTFFVRAVTDTDRVSYRPVERMIVVKDEMPQVDTE